MPILLIKHQFTFYCEGIFKDIIKIVSAFYNITVDDIKSTNRAAKTAYARQVAIYLAKELTNESFPAVGDYFNRKHTTIMYSHQKVKSDIAIDRHLAKDITELTEKINELKEAQIEIDKKDQNA